jgi:mannosyltransferase OCH1-like enzyme
MSKSIVKLLLKNNLIKLHKNININLKTSNLIIDKESKKNIIIYDKIYSTNIPKILHLCYKNKNIPEYIIPNWKNLNPDYEVILYDDNDCVSFLMENYGKLYVDIFNFIKDGPIKADFFRICVLYKLGGVYCDIDIQPLISFNDFIEPDISFLTCLSVTQRQLNPHIIMCDKDHHLLKLCINIYIDYYQNKTVYSYWVWSIVHIMKKCIKTIFPNIFINDCLVTDNNKNRYQFLKEVGDFNNVKNIYCKYKEKKVLNNRYQNYDPDLHQFE